MKEIQQLLGNIHFRAGILNMVKNKIPKVEYYNLSEDKELLTIGTESSNISINLLNGDVNVNGNIKLGSGALFHIIGVEQGSDNEYLHIKKDGSDKWIPLFDSLP